MKACSIARAVSLAAALMMAAMSSGCQYLFPKEEEPQAPPLVAPKGVEYTTVDVERGDIVSSVQGMGRVQSVRMVDVYFRAGGGRLKGINVKYGDMVKAGDVLLELDTGDLDYQLEVAKLRYKAQQNSYNANKGYMRKVDRDNAKIELQIAKMGIEQLQKQKDEATLKAPIDGSVVYITTANQGSYVDAYSTLVRIADQSVKMLSYEDDANRASFQIGMKVQVTLKSGGSQCEGVVVSTPFERGKFDTEKLAKMLFIQVPDEFLANTEVGDEARLVVILAERKDALWLPRNVVKTYLQRRYVQALVNGVKVEKDVQVGLETPTQTEILSGLEEGEKVIVR